MTVSAQATETSLMAVDKEVAPGIKQSLQGVVERQDQPESW